MPTLTPVDYDPFERTDLPVATPSPVTLTPVDYDPFAEEPVPPVPERSWGEALTDTGKSLFLKGGANLLRNAYDVADLQSGGTLNRSIKQLTGHDVDRALGQLQQNAADTQSSAFKAKEQTIEQIKNREGTLAALMHVAKDPGYVVDQIAQSASMMLPLAGAARMGALRGAEQAAARQLVGHEAEHLAQKSAERYAAVGEGVMEGADAAASARDRVNQMPENTLLQNSADYRALLAQGMTPDQARYALAEQAGKTAAAITIPVAALAGKVTGASDMEAKVLRGQLSGGTAVRQLAGEGAQEVIQEGINQFGQNVGLQQNVDPQQALSEDVAFNAALGGITGAAQGGGIHVLDKIRGAEHHADSPQNLQSVDEEPPDSPSTRLAPEVTATPASDYPYRTPSPKPWHEPDAGPLTRAVGAGVEAGTIPDPTPSQPEQAPIHSLPYGPSLEGEVLPPDIPQEVGPAQQRGRDIDGEAWPAADAQDYATALREQLADQAPALEAPSPIPRLPYRGGEFSNTAMPELDPATTTTTDSPELTPAPAERLASDIGVAPRPNDVADTTPAEIAPADVSPKPEITPVRRQFAGGEGIPAQHYDRRTRSGGVENDLPQGWTVDYQGDEEDRLRLLNPAGKVRAVSEGGRLTPSENLKWQAISQGEHAPTFAVGDPVQVRLNANGGKAWHEGQVELAGHENGWIGVRTHAGKSLIRASEVRHVDDEIPPPLPTAPTPDNPESAAPTFDVQDGKLLTNAPVVTFTTSQGKNKTGVFVPHGVLSAPQIKSLYGAPHKNGVFVADKHISRQSLTPSNAADEVPTASKTPPGPLDGQALPQNPLHLNETATTEEPSHDLFGRRPAPSGVSSDAALEGISAQDVQNPQDRGPLADGGDVSRPENSGTASAADSGRPAPRKRVGNRAGDLFVHAGGTGDDAGAGGRRGLPLGSGRTDGAESGLPPHQRVSDYRITETTRLGEGGHVTKYKNNLTAIRLLKTLQSEGRNATPEEQDSLARYAGWGALPQAFDPDNRDWAERHAELKELLPNEEYDAARESTQYAHFTSHEVIQGIYDAVRHLGFSGGKILEPGSGVGNFIGLMPDDLKRQSHFTGVERERISAGIAKHLYPGQNIQQNDFTRFSAPNDYFDAVIGNPPFSSTALTDLSGRKHLSGMSVHNYFFAKSVDMLRPGGVFAMVVSNSFMDAVHDRTRQYIGERAKLLGAIRLPRGAFGKNAGTDVTTDIVFLQKLPESEWVGKAARDGLKGWRGTALVDDPHGGERIPINQYFVEHPDMMLGRMERTGGRYSKETANLEGDVTQVPAQLAAAIARLPARVYTAASTQNTQTMQDQAIQQMRGLEVQEGGYFMKDDALYLRLRDEAGQQRAQTITPSTPWSEKLQLGIGRYNRLKALAALRRTVRDLIAAEMRGDASMENLRATLNQQYDAYVKENGLLNESSNVQLYGEDPDFPLLASLEHGFDKGISASVAKAQGVQAKKPSAKKAPIFSRRVIEPRAEVTQADNPIDALMVSIAERGHINSTYMGELLGRDGDEVLKELAQGEKPHLFHDPATGEYVLRDAYLSGNVRKKLELAKEYGLEGNVRALEAVIPEDVPSHEIVGRLGAPWIPGETYVAFIRHLLGEATQASVRYVPQNSSFRVAIDSASEVANRNQYGTSRMGATDIIDALLNNRDIRVMDYSANKDVPPALNKAATDEANDKATDIRAAFGDWLFADADRAEQLGRIYNDRMNNYVRRVFDGSPLTFPGKVPDAIIKFRRHQRNAIARILQTGRGLLDHVVGAGKTFTIIGAVMEGRRTGLMQKPMIAVPNHLVRQWAADVYRLYPGANVLMASKKDFERQNRRTFLAKIATGNWDAVVIAHSSFGFIKPEPEFEGRFNQQQMDLVVDAIQSLKSEKDSGSKRTVKQLEALKERLENRINALRDRKVDDLLDFAQLGVDALFVDEAHMFKNLMYATKMQNVRGLGQAKGSQRAYDMYLKTQQLFDQNGDHRGVVFATGTPVSNSLAEMYHMMRYLQPEVLAEMGHETFDAWANTFAEVEQVWMQAMSGDGYKASNRMSRFVNAPELIKIFDQVSDTVTLDDIKKAYAEENNGTRFPIPALKGGRRTPVSIPISLEQTRFMGEVARRAKALERRRGKPQKGDDNMLSIMGDARKAAMDIRLVEPSIVERDPDGRIARAATNVFERYQRFHTVRGTQLIFSDMGVPRKHMGAALKEYEALQAATAPLSDENLRAVADLGDETAIAKLAQAEEAQNTLDSKGRDWKDAIEAAKRGFSIYDDMRSALIEHGIPEQEIAFIHDYNTDDQKAGLFRAVNEGRIRVLLGSTEKMGAGTNVQERAVALHHLDVPWKPSDVEQREGRVVRQGNALLQEIGPDFEVEVLAYATQDTLDLFMWQTQEKKLAMINQLRTGTIGREIDNAFEEMQMSAGEMQAAATSNPYLLEEIQLKDQIKKLERQQKSFIGQQNDIKNRIKRAERDIAELPAHIEQARELRRHAKAYETELASRAASLDIEGENYTDRDKAAARLRELTGEDENQTELEKGARMTPFMLDGQKVTSKAAVAERFTQAFGDANPITMRVDGKTLIRRKDIAAAIAPRLNLSAEQDSVEEVAEMGAFRVEVEVIPRSNGDVALNVSLYLGDNHIHSRSIVYDSKEELTRLGPRYVVDVAETMASRAGNNLIWMRADLEKAEQQLAEAKKLDTTQSWPKQAELENARVRYREVLKNLAETTESQDKGEADSDPDGADQEVMTHRARTYQQGSSVSVRAIENALASVRRDWRHAPQIHVVHSVEDLPAAIRSQLQQQNALQDVEGLLDKTTGVWLIADRLTSTDHALHVLLHEVLGHHGLRGVFGQRLQPLLAHVFDSNPTIRARAQQLMQQFGYGKALAVEEVLADMAGNGELVHQSLWRRLVAAIRHGLRAIGIQLDVTDDDVRDMLRRSRAYVKGRASRQTSPTRQEPVVTKRGEPASPHALFEAGRQAAGEFFKSERTFNRWWHTTVGTQYHKAQVDQDYRRVFNAGQAFLHDTSRLSMQAENMAPSLLPKISTLNDLIKNGRQAFAPGRKVDLQAAGKALFDGTLRYRRDEDGSLQPNETGVLSEGVVFTDAELRSLFKLSEPQIRLYREARAAIDTSIDDLARATLYKLLRESTANPRIVESLRYSQAPLSRLDTVIRVELAKAQQVAQLKGDHAAVNSIGRLHQQVSDVIGKAQSLQQQGYAPLMRFGRYTVDVTDEQGNRLAFMMFESQLEANWRARQLARDNPKATIRKGVMSEEGFKLFKGLTPETLVLFADALGINQDAAFQEYLHTAIANRSAMKRLIHRQGIAGFSEDISRVTASFIISNARLSSGHLNMADLVEAVDAVPQAKGDVKDEAIKLKEYLTEPAEEAAALRGFLFMNFLGGSVASALVNLTQPVTMSFPHLANQFGGIKASAALCAAAKDIFSQKLLLDLQEAMDRAIAQGIVAPHEIHQLMAEAGGSVIDRFPAVRAFKAVWGSLFAGAETVNRRMTFIAAYRLAQDAKMRNPFQYAVDAVTSTQGLYNRGNRPDWARGALGATVFTFKQYSVGYLEWFKRLDRRGQLYALAVLMMLSGMQGLPFAEDIEDIIDTLGRWLGFATQSKKTLHQAVIRAIGEDMGKIGLNGLSGVPGMPIDVQARLGLGNLIPGTRLLTPFEPDKSRDVQEWIGPIAGVAKQAGDSIEKFSAGDIGQGFAALVPVAIKNLLQGADMAAKGYYSDTRGRKVIDTDTGDAIAKAVGFQPESVADTQRRLGFMQNDNTMHRSVEASIADDWAQALAVGDTEGVREAKGRLAVWNKQNPDFRIQIQPRQIFDRVKQIRQTKAQRVGKAAPRELRGAR